MRDEIENDAVEDIIEKAEDFEARTQMRGTARRGNKLFKSKQFSLMTVVMKKAQLQWHKYCIYNN